MIEIDIADNQRCLDLDQAWFTLLTEHALREENISAAELSIAFVDNQTIHKLNKQFLQHDYPTDVITFPLSTGGERLIGEIVISAEYGQQQAGEFKWPPHLEVGLYLVHGVLHLCGYDDHDEQQAARMHHRQHSILKRYLEQRGEPCSYSSFQCLSSRQFERESCH